MNRGWRGLLGRWRDSAYTQHQLDALFDSLARAGLQPLLSGSLGRILFRQPWRLFWPDAASAVPKPVAPPA